ncbi:MAG: flagellar basal body-associated FliL family protein [Planctomycetes bacterium]|nr:flagellar basal body-associated FliL family protein [Planctomycetota bacterium]
MKTRSFLAAVALAILLGGPVAAVAWRGWAIRQEARGDETLLIPFERVDHTVSMPPDHNARVLRHVQPEFRIRKRHEEEVRRLLEFHRPRILDAVQGILSRMHFSVIDKGEGTGSLSRQIREEVNGILGGPFVVEVVLPNRPAE